MILNDSQCCANQLCCTGHRVIQNIASFGGIQSRFKLVHRNWDRTFGPSRRQWPHDDDKNGDNDNDDDSNNDNDDDDGYDEGDDDDDSDDDENNEDDDDNDDDEKDNETMLWSIASRLRQ